MRLIVFVCAMVFAASCGGGGSSQPAADAADAADSEAVNGDVAIATEDTAESLDTPADSPGDAPTDLPTDLSIDLSTDTATDTQTDTPVDEVCTPDCVGAVCGDDGCGGSCGECPAGKQCQNGACLGGADSCLNHCGDSSESGNCYCDELCAEYGDCCADVCAACPGLSHCGGCEPSCVGKECGDDGCGGSCWTSNGPECGEDKVCVNGTCIEGGGGQCAGMCGGSAGGCYCDDICQQSGDCCPGVCDDCPELTFCSCEPSCDGKECGDDGCWGSCGECMPGYGCVNGTCVEGACMNANEIQDCDGNCGPIYWLGDGICDDGGTGANFDCEEFDFDGGDCVCLPDCDGKNCGDDGCEGSCGECDEGFVCYQGACLDENCEPACDGKDCGWDGCFGDCGACTGEAVCVLGSCLEGELSCVDFYSCVVGCEGDDLCFYDCTDKASQQAMTQYDTFVNCLMDNGYFECLDDACYDEVAAICEEEILACLQGDLDCLGMTGCMAGCAPGDDPCPSLCYWHGTPTAQDDYNAFIDCLNEQCDEESPDECWEEAQQGPCQDWTLTCLGELPCTPDCEGKECWEEDGCGGTCGLCPLELWVDDDALDDPDADGSQEHPFPTLTQALDLATPDSTIHILAGTYPAAAEVTVPGLQILGPEEGDPAVFDAALEEGSVGLKVSADQVTLARLTLQSYPTGILAEETTGLVLNALRVTGSELYGVRLQGGAGAELTGLLVEDCGGAPGAACEEGQPCGDGGNLSGVKLTNITGAVLHGCTIRNLSGGAGGDGTGAVSGDGGNAYGLVLQGGEDLELHHILVHDIHAGAAGASDLEGDDCCGEIGNAAGVLVTGGSGELFLSHLTIASVDGPGVRLGSQRADPVVLLDSILSIADQHCLLNTASNPAWRLVALYSTLFGCNLEDPANALQGPGCLADDPLLTEDFLLDPASPAIDAASPCAPCEAEPQPSGCAANQGAYGDTPSATPTPDADPCDACTPAPDCQPCEPICAEPTCTWDGCWSDCGGC